MAAARWWVLEDVEVHVKTLHFQQAFAQDSDEAFYLAMQDVPSSLLPEAWLTGSPTS